MVHTGTIKKAKKIKNSDCSVRDSRLLNLKQKIYQFYRRTTDNSIVIVEASWYFNHNFMLGHCTCCKPLYKNILLFELVLFYILLKFSNGWQWNNFRSIRLCSRKLHNYRCVCWKLWIEKINHGDKNIPFPIIHLVTKNSMFLILFLILAVMIWTFFFIYRPTMVPNIFAES